MTINKSLIFLVILAFSSCQSSNNASRHSGTNKTPFSDISILERPLPDHRGIITYKEYQIFVANGNETVEEIASRLSIEPKRLASYNGVLLTYLPRKDEILALPIKIAGELVSTPSGWSEEGARTAITNSMNKEIKNIGTPDNPLKHRVEPGETAYSVARLYDISVTSLAKWNGLDTDLKLTVGRELIIPVKSGTSSYLSPSSSQQGANQNDSSRVISEKNDANLENKQNEQLNDSTDKSNPGSIANNNDEAEIAQEDNNKVVEKPYVRPVPGKVLRAYNPTATSDKNEGIDFHADPGTPIKAAADGVVALISKPVGGLGKIVLIKHDKSVISIYGRVKDLIVSKGSRVVQGQIIGKVENSFADENSSEKKNYLHFELRKGTKSLDPEPLLQ